MHPRASCLRLVCCLFGSILLADRAVALDDLRFVVAGADASLEKDLRAASLVASAYDDKRTEPREILSAALADYGRLLETLYAHGYYSGVIRIGLDGREVADMPLLSVPDRLKTVAISIDPGPPFRFGQATVSPLAAGTVLPAAFDTGQPARSIVVREAVETAVDGWRDAGHAKARPASQTISADHADHTLSADIRLDQGPRVRFGNLDVASPSAVRVERIKRIAGLPSGEVFSPATLKRMTTRLRRTGAFSSISFDEAETLGPGDTMDISLMLADEKPRRYGFGAEISSLEGLNLTGYWVHRNLFGGAERLRLDAEVRNIGGPTGGIDYSAGARIDIPAMLGPDTGLFVLSEYEHLDEPDFLSDRIAFGGGVAWYPSDQLQAEAGATYMYSQTNDGLGARNFSLLTFPASVTLDKRDNPLDPTGGYFARLDATPFVGLDGSAPGARGMFDGRIYRGLGRNDGTVLAARLQFGTVVGAGITDVYPDFLFYSGGGGTVRGQPYKSLGVDLGGGTRIGGTSFVGISLEARTTVTENIGAVAFYDAGYIGAESFYDGSGDWHSGAGLGVRYKTGIGPIRFDVAVPAGGDTGSGVQIYLGIGQAF